jgi:hypothetical protein
MLNFCSGFYSYTLTFRCIYLRNNNFVTSILNFNYLFDGCRKILNVTYSQSNQLRIELSEYFENFKAKTALKTS